MEEENQVQQVTTKKPHQVKQVTTKEPQQVQQVTTKEPHQVQQGPTKDLKKVEAGKRLAEYNGKKRKEQKSEVNQYYGIEAVLAVGVIGGPGYYLYQAKKAQQPSHLHSPQQTPKANKFEMD